MADRISFTAISPIGDTDVMSIPVSDMESGLDYYTRVLGFEAEKTEPSRAVLKRDDVRIGIAVNDVDPEQASMYIGVSDLDAFRAELTHSGCEDMSDDRLDDHGGTQYRIFFVREPFGACFCFGQPA